MNSDELKELLNELNSPHHTLIEELYYIKKAITILLVNHIEITELEEIMIEKMEKMR